MNRLFDRIPFLNKYVPGKIILSFLMLVFSIILAVSIGTTDRKVCILAVMFSFLGDIILNHNAYYTNNSRLDFLYGGISFIVAHSLFCIAYTIKIINNGYNFFNYGILIALAILMLTSLLIIITKSSITPYQLYGFGFLYLWGTGIDYIVVFSYAVSARPIGYLAMLGGFMFLVSDVIIGLEKFAGLKSKIARELVWWLYPIGQILMIVMA